MLSTVNRVNINTLVPAVTKKSPLHRRKARAYLDAVRSAGDNITDAQWHTASSAIRLLTRDLDKFGLSRIQVWFPYIGANAACHAIDLISGTSAMTFGGTVTHDTNGITGDGSTGYGYEDSGAASNVCGAGCYGKAIDNTSEVVFADAMFWGFWGMKAYGSAGVQAAWGGDGASAIVFSNKAGASGNWGSLFTQRKNSTLLEFYKGDHTGKNTRTAAEGAAAFGHDGCAVLASRTGAASFANYSTHTLSSFWRLVNGETATTDAEVDLLMNADTTFQTNLGRN